MALIWHDPVQLLDLRRSYVDCAVVIVAKRVGTAKPLVAKIPKER